MGGSNDLQIGRNFFSGVFMIFVHKIKNDNKKLKKSEKMEHPSGGDYMAKYLPTNMKERRKAFVVMKSTRGTLS